VYLFAKVGVGCGQLLDVTVLYVGSLRPLFGRECIAQRRPALRGRHSLLRLYALLALYGAASPGELSLDDEITMRASDVWADGTGVLYRYLEEEIDTELRPTGARSTSYWLPNTTPDDVLLVLKDITPSSSPKGPRRWRLNKRFGRSLAADRTLATPDAR
jgi:hypothetical protein